MIARNEPAPKQSASAPESAKSSVVVFCTLRDAFFGHLAWVHPGFAKALAYRAQVRGNRRRSSRGQAGPGVAEERQDDSRKPETEPSSRHGKGNYRFLHGKRPFVEVFRRIAARNLPSNRSPRPRVSSAAMMAILVRVYVGPLGAISLTGLYIHTLHAVVIPFWQFHHVKWDPMGICDRSRRFFARWLQKISENRPGVCKSL